MANTRRKQSRAIAAAAAASDPPSGDENETSGAVPGKAPRAGTFRWPPELKIQLLEVADREEFRVVLRGKQNASDNAKPIGKTKNSAYADMAKILLPDLWKEDAKLAAKKVNSQYDAMTKLHKQLNAELNATGSGVGGDQEGEALQEVELEGYIGRDGPTVNTTPQLSTKWDELVAKCSFWPTLHRMFGTHPTQVPIATTTGLGPEGPRTTLHQKLSSPPLPSSPWDLITGPHAAVKPQDDKPPHQPDSDIEILEHSRSPSPEVEGNGKGVDKRERGGKGIKPKEETAKEMKVKEKTDAKEKDVRVKGVKDVKVKGTKDTKDTKDTKENGEKEKSRPPRPSLQLDAANPGDMSGSTSSSSGGRKRKSREDGFLSMMHESMTERYQRIDARHEHELADAQFRNDMERHERMMGTMPMSIYYQRKNEIRVQHGRQPPTVPDLNNHGPQMPVARTQPRAQPFLPSQPQPRAQPRPQPRTHTAPPPQTPTCRDAKVIHISSSPIIIESSSPIKREPPTTPIKQEPSSATKEEEVDGLMDECTEAEEYLALNNARDEPVFKTSAFDFRP
ncbi:hypothetical protein FS749_009331 [Ceratobasidium sp. UAMH 11750]|nr:hypothetical protein FS749_009331 [Ceratobasidium sp. UAMH 11750]